MGDDDKFNNVSQGRKSAEQKRDDWEDETQAVHYGEPDDDTEAPRAQQAYLIVLAGTRVGNMVKVTDGLTVGRGLRAGFRTIDEGVSRSHARIIEREDGALCVEDLGSRNGTFVNGERIAQPMPLSDGDKIQIGTTTILKFSYADRLEESFQKQMYNAALRDPLTRIFNRRHFDEQLLSEFSYALRHSKLLSLIMMDLDHFKQVNDTRGHLVGDAVLVGLAELLQRSTRKEDLFARYGGEEFTLLCRDTSSLTAFSIANRIRRQMEQCNIVPEIPELHVTLSAGVAGVPDPSVSSPQQLVEAADKALYQAKALGRNRVCVYDPEMDTSVPPESDEAADDPDRARLDTEPVD
jgi:two-component system cell cycle response regulator